MSQDQATAALGLAPGWVRRWENGVTTPPLAILLQLIEVYGSTPGSFFSAIGDPDEDLLALDRQVAVEDDCGVPVLQFPMGNKQASVRLDGAQYDQALHLLADLRHRLSGTGSTTDAVSDVFLEAVRLWPAANPSDIWYFFLSRAYLDRYNHPANDDKDWAQSWKRTGGWALERIVCRHYNPHLVQYGIELQTPPRARKVELLAATNLTRQKTVLEKADVLAVAKGSSGAEFCFGVIHVKASLAERRTDDVPLSQELLSLGYISPIVLMDCKASPSENPINRGEYGQPGTASTEASQKRADIEEHRKFGAAFSFNLRTVPTPDGGHYAARIHNIDFTDPDDAFAQHVIQGLVHRTGQPVQKLTP